MNNIDEKKTITIKQGIGDDAFEMTVNVTKEELDKMEQLRQSNPEKWVGKDLELIEEARNSLKRSYNEVSSSDQPTQQQPTETDASKNNNTLSKGMKWTVIILGLLLLSYKLYLLYLNTEVNEFRSAVSGYDVTSDYSYLQKTGEFGDFFHGIGTADYYLLIPFTRLMDASSTLSLKNDIENGVQLRDSQKVLLDAIKLGAETEYKFGHFTTKWEKAGQNAPIIIEVLFWLLIAFLCFRKF